MHIPASPPPVDCASFVEDPGAVPQASAAAQRVEGYPHWDKLRRLSFDDTPPALVWSWIKMGRLQTRRQLPLRQADGSPFWYTLPDVLLASLMRIAWRATGQIEAPAPVTDPYTRDRYIVRSLMEEAITSSQLEGASTTQRIAKDMLRTGRPPATKDERMIANNYAALQWVQAHREDPITSAGILALHEIVTEGTLDDPDAASRIQGPDEIRVGVWSNADAIEIHQPPPAEDLPRRLEDLAAFANAEEPWMPTLLRAIICHFMVGYDHYFVDGNGRLARALFYWVALREGAWLLEFAPISRILKEAPAQYVRSYLDTETDEGDVTYFAIYQAKVIERAIEDLHHYLGRKADEQRQVADALPELNLNHRQRAVIEGMMREPGRSITVQSHAASHNISEPTARHDLRRLAELGLLAPGRRRGRQESWREGQELVRLRHAPRR